MASGRPRLEGGVERVLSCGCNAMRQVSPLVGMPIVLQETNTSSCLHSGLSLPRRKCHTLLACHTHITKTQAEPRAANITSYSRFRLLLREKAGAGAEQTGHRHVPVQLFTCILPDISKGTDGPITTTLEWIDQLLCMIFQPFSSKHGINADLDTVPRASKCPNSYRF